MNNPDKPSKDKAYSLEKELPDIAVAEKEIKQGVLNKFRSQLQKTREHFFEGLKRSLMGERELDEELFDEIEETLLSADFGVDTTRRILSILENEYEQKKIHTEKEAFATICRIIVQILEEKSSKTLVMNPDAPTVFLFVGVNGVGKTTTIGKLAQHYKNEGKKVLLAAGDTFRAAAIEQLREWSERSEVDIHHKKINSDPSATLFEAAIKARQEKYDILLCDTSGRLHTKKNLMDELEKMKRSLTRNIPNAPHHIILILDATTGQNAINQTKEFQNTVGVNGLIVTKLDGTSKAGMIVGIVNELSIPVYFIGVGEKIDDLQPFEADTFAQALLDL